MAIKVTGFFQNPQTGLIHQSPLLTLIPHLLYAGKIVMDVKINEQGCIGYENIDRTTLQYDSQITDPYSQLIDALETYLIDNLQNANEINSNSVFEKYVPPVVEETPQEEIIPQEEIL